MRSPIVSVGVLLIGITFAAIDVAAQSGDASGNFSSCNQGSPTVQLNISATWSDTSPWAIAIGFAPVYDTQSPSSFYVSPDGSGSAQVDVAKTIEGYYPDPPTLPLGGAFVWVEYGYWWFGIWSGTPLGEWVWVPWGGGGCFAAGTPLRTPEGSKPIEQFRAGDWILSSRSNDAKAPAVARRVKEVIRKRGKLMDIAVSGQVVHATSEHPFYVKGKGWTRAASLTIGDLLRSHDDRFLPVESIVNAAESHVYNVSVEGNGTYFVGGRDWGFSVWVYGACNKPETQLEQVVQSNPMGSFFQKGETASKPVAFGIADGGRPETGLQLLLATFNSKPNRPNNPTPQRSDRMRLGAKNLFSPAELWRK